jgi:WD40 repeat protein/serine/threonine protein kinase
VRAVIGDDATPQEEELAAFLAAIDDALADNIPPPAAKPSEAIQARLNDDLNWLHLLHQLRQPGSAAEPVESSAAEEPAPRYTVIRLQGEGGVGQVWLVHDADLGRDVALKELRSERMCNRPLAARFLREARITAQLQHPGIVPVYDLAPGRFKPDGRWAEPPFYTMRFVQGRTLSEAARTFHEKRAAGTAGPLDQAALLNAFVRVCDTVAYAHSRFVIHRDLKSENVALGDFGEVMVLDWGFAKFLGESEENTGLMADPTPHGPANQTVAGQILGTPAYMAPEQAAGRPELVDCRTDVYGLGAILYEILTGRPPFVGTDAQEVLRQVREEEPPPPQKVCSDVPRPLAAVCRKALARDPAARYASATDLGREIQRWLADEPVLAHPEPAMRRLQRWARRNKTLVAAVAALVFTCLTALGLGTYLLERQQTRAAAEQSTRASAAREVLETQLYYHRIALAERERAANNPSRATQLLADCPERQRGWEWYCLNRLCYADPLTLRGHTAAVSAIAFSPDGNHLVSAGHDRTARIWDTRTGAPIRTLTGHDDVVYGVSYSPDGDRIASGSWDRTVKVWDATTGKVILVCRGHDEVITRVAFSPDGRLLASLSSEAVWVWDARTGAPIRTLGPVGGRNRYGLAFSPDSRFVAVTTDDPQVVIWEVETGKEMQVFHGHTSAVKNVAFSPDGRLVASGAGDIARSQPGEVKVWLAESGQEVFSLHGHTDPIYGVAFSPNGKRLVSASQDHTVKIWDSRTGQETLTIHAHADTVRAVVFSPDGQRLATACVDGEIKIWDATPLETEKPAHHYRTLVGHGATVFSVAFFPDGRRLAALSDNETIRTWDVNAGHELEYRRLAVEPQIYALALSPDAHLLATATTDGIVWLIDPTTGERKRELRGHPHGPVKSLAFSPDGRHLAMSSWVRAVWVFDVTTGDVIRTLSGHDDAVIGVAYSPDGRLIASASYDQTVRIWDAETGEMRYTLLGHTSRVFSVAFSPKGDLLASASDDGTIRLWNPKTGTLIRTVPAHASGVYGLAFSPNGKHLASASNDWTVKLWNPATGAETTTFRGHSGRVHAIAFSPDSRKLASGGADQTVTVWNVPD